jgi:hypothetical protein
MMYPDSFNDPWEREQREREQLLRSLGIGDYANAAAGAAEAAEAARRPGMRESVRRWAGENPTVQKILQSGPVKGFRGLGTTAKLGGLAAGLGGAAAVIGGLSELGDPNESLTRNALQGAGSAGGGLAGGAAGGALGGVAAGALAGLGAGPAAPFAVPVGMILGGLAGSGLGRGIGDAAANMLEGSNDPELRRAKRAQELALEMDKRRMQEMLPIQAMAADVATRNELEKLQAQYEMQAAMARQQALSAGLLEQQRGTAALQQMITQGLFS